MLTSEQAESFRRVSIGDPAAVKMLMGRSDSVKAVLGERSASLVRLAAVIALDSSMPAYQQEVRHALDAGADVEAVMAVLTAIAPIAGSAIVMSAAPKVAMALGYDVDAALEGTEPSRITRSA
jgi:4-carboxymuconolactone decarboxylase